VAGTAYGVGAQDLYWKESGAYTGEVARTGGRVLPYVIIGHSERRE
jgi:triosephosphate isomerase